MGSPQPGKMDVTLVAYYGDKPLLIETLIKGAINELSDALGSEFIPYTLQQVHGTIIGLEGARVDNYIINTNYVEKRNELRSVDLNAALQVLMDESLLPFNITIGGFVDGGQYSFTSRNLAPYFRSFSIQGAYAVAMGWPYINGEYSKSIDKLRRAFNQANILHKYHSTPDTEDNDFFFVLGSIVNEDIDQIQLEEAQVRLRSFLAAHEGVRVPITRDKLRVVAYVDPKLPLETSCSYTLDEAQDKIDEIRSLYRSVLA